MVGLKLRVCIFDNWGGGHIATQVAQLCCEPD